jgi:hypothetical protein
MERWDVERKGIEVICNVLTNLRFAIWNLEITHPLPQPDKNPKVRFRETGICSQIKHANPILVVLRLHMKSCASVQR